MGQSVEEGGNGSGSGEKRVSIDGVVDKQQRREGCMISKTAVSNGVVTGVAQQVRK